MTLSSGENRNGKTHTHIGIRRPLIFTELEVVGHRDHTVREVRREGRQVGVLLHPDSRGKLLGLNLKLTQGRVVLQRRITVLVDVPEHLLGEILKGTGHIYISVQIDTHHSLELPESQNDGAFSVVNVRDSGRHG